MVVVAARSWRGCEAFFFFSLLSSKGYSSSLSSSPAQLQPHNSRIACASVVAPVLTAILVVGGLFVLGEIFSSFFLFPTLGTMELTWFVSFYAFVLNRRWFDFELRSFYRHRSSCCGRCCYCSCRRSLSLLFLHRASSFEQHAV